MNGSLPYLHNAQVPSALRHETAARLREQAGIDAERNARDRRLDRDRIVFAALETLEHVATSDTLDGSVSAFIAGAADIRLARFTNHTERAVYIRELLSEIRAELSPLVRS